MTIGEAFAGAGVSAYGRAGGGTMVTAIVRPPSSVLIRIFVVPGDLPTTTNAAAVAWFVG